MVSRWQDSSSNSSSSSSSGSGVGVTDLIVKIGVVRGVFNGLRPQTNVAVIAPGEIKTRVSFHGGVVKGQRIHINRVIG